jgi:hypothetical protein
MSSSLPVDRTPVDKTKGLSLATVLRWRWPVWMALTVLLYYPIFLTHPVFDDMGHVEFVAQQGWHLLHMGPHFFRPLERILIGLNWLFYGDNFWVVKTVALLAFVLSVSLVHDLAARIVSPKLPWAPFVIATIFLVHPMHVSAVGKIDTFSEGIASVFALLVVRCAMAAAEAAPGPAEERTALYWAMWSVPAVLLGMFSKEAFAGLAAATPLLFAVALRAPERESRRTLAWLVAGLGVAAALYFAARIASGFPLVGTPTPAARYQLHFGVNVPLNLAAEIVSIAFPGSTLALFARFDATEIAVSSVLLVMLLVFLKKRVGVTLARWSQIPPERRRMMLIILIAAIASLFPTCLIPELISENQTALPLPFLVLLALACPLVLPFEADRQRPLQPIVLSCTCTAVFLCMALATSGKVLAAQEASDQAYRRGDLILAAFHEHPTAVVTACFEPSMRTEPVKYGIFSVPDDLAAYYQLTRLKVERPGIVIKVVDLRLKDAGKHPECTLHISGMSVTR